MKPAKFLLIIAALLCLNFTDTGPVKSKIKYQFSSAKSITGLTCCRSDVNYLLGNGQLFFVDGNTVQIKTTGEYILNYWIGSDVLATNSQNAYILLDRDTLKPSNGKITIDDIEGNEYYGRNLLKVYGAASDGCHQKMTYDVIQSGYYLKDSGGIKYITHEERPDEKITLRNISNEMSSIILNSPNGFTILVNDGRRSLLYNTITKEEFLLPTGEDKNIVIPDPPPSNLHIPFYEYVGWFPDGMSILARKWSFRWDLNECGDLLEGADNGACGRDELFVYSCISQNIRKIELPPSLSDSRLHVYDISNKGEIVLSPLKSHPPTYYVLELLW